MRFSCIVTGINHVLDGNGLSTLFATRQPEQVATMATVTPPPHRRPRGPSILSHLPKGSIF
jgi:hypothetical protein